jgi:hypothetical protein
LDRRLGELESQNGRGSEEKISQPLPGLKLLIIQPLDQEKNYFICTARNTTLCEMHFSANMTKNLCMIVKCEWN